MPAPWSLEDANAALPRVREAIAKLRAAAPENRAGGNGQVTGPADDELRHVVEAFLDEGIVLRDAERGIVDFEAVAPSGRPYYLCWLDGEPEIAFWHWYEDGFAGRKPLDEFPE